MNSVVNTVKKWADNKEVAYIEIHDPSSIKWYGYSTGGAKYFLLNVPQVHFGIRADNLATAGRVALEFLRDLYGREYIKSGRIVSEPFERFLIERAEGGDTEEWWVEKD